MSLTTRLNLMITVLLLMIMLAGAVLTVRNAREDVRAEVHSTATLALHLLDAEIAHYTSDYSWLGSGEMYTGSIFRLQSLGEIRHLRIEFYDAFGRLRDSNQVSGEEEQLREAPRWFVRLMNVGQPLEEIRRPIFVSSRLLGELVVTPDTSYEIAEVWSDTMDLLWLVGLFFVLVSAMIYWAVRSALLPVKIVMAALTELERGRLDARLPQFELPELAGLSIKFNTMAQTLQQSIDRNHRLTQKIIRLQEDERKKLARELHDEIGQYITAINVDAMAIINSKRLSAARQSASAIAEVAMYMLDMVHNMLQRLRPGVLDELGLSIALNEYVGTWRQRQTEIHCDADIAADLGEVDEIVALAVYRIVQESLTNISRHADARNVTITVKREGPQLLVQLTDDGRGFDPNDVTSGYGLAGIRERVQGLGGTIRLDSAPLRGCRILVTLPCHLEENL